MSKERDLCKLNQKAVKKTKVKSNGVLRNNN